MPPEDPFSGDFTELERVARNTVNLSEQSLRNMRDAEQAATRLNRVQTGPTGPVGGSRARVASFTEEAGAIDRLRAATERAAVASGQFEATQARMAALGRGVGPVLRENAAAIGTAAGRGAGYGAAPPGGGGRPPAPPIVPPPPPPPGDRGGARAAAITDANRLATAQRAESLATQRSSIELQRQISVLSASSQAYRRHGALTTEFISAAARGEASYREWGYQIGATAAKFAGWTAVSIPVFAALNAVRELGQGAIATQGALQNLQRFVPNLNQDQATQGYVQTARQLIVPIKDVADAQASFARIFHDQRDSLTAARTALLATKLDNVAAADSYRFFTGIIQEWKLNADQLPLVFDQISAAQRRLGARVSEVLPALAKSSSTIKNTGGDISQLIALLALAQTTSGQTGNVVGTAFARGAANFYRSPTSVATERGFGLDPTQSFTRFLIEAIQKGSQLSGVERQQLSKAVFGPLRGGLLAGLFTQAGRLPRALQVTSPEAAKGSAEEELRRVRAQAGEQVKRFGIELQALGANLIRSGLLAPLGTAAEKGLDLIGIGNRIFAAFNTLPAPVSVFGTNLRQAAVAAFALLGALRVAQRFQFAGGVTRPLSRYSGVLAGGAGLGVQRQVGRGLRDEVTFFEDERARRARLAALAVTESDIVQRQTQAEVRTATSQEEIVAAQTRALAARDRALDLAREEEAVNIQLAESQARAAAYQSQVVRGKTTALEFARANQLYFVPTTDRPTTARPTAAGIAGRSASSVAGDAPTRARAVLAYINQIEAEGGRAATVAQRLRFAGSRVASAVTSFGVSLRSMGASLASMIGPFELVLAGAIIIPAVYGAEKQALDAHQKLLAQLSRSPVSPTDLARLRDQASRAAGHDTLFGNLRNAINETLLPVGESAHQRSQRVANATLDDIIRTQQAQNAQLIAGSRTGAQRGPRADLLPQQVEDSANADTLRIRQGLISLREAHKRLDQRLQEVDLTSRTTPTQKADIAYRIRSQYFQAIADRTKSNATYLIALANESGTALQQQSTALAALIQANIAPAGGRSRYGAVEFEQIVRALQQAEPGSKSSTTKPGSGQQLLAQLTQQWTQTMEQDAKAQFDRSTLFARTTAQRNRAWDRYVNYVRTYGLGPAEASVKSIRGERTTLESQIQRGEHRLADLLRVRTATRRQSFGEPIDLSGFDEEIKLLRSRLIGLRARLGAHDQRLGRAERELKQLQLYERQFRAERQRERFQQQQQIYDAQTEVGAYGYSAGLPRLQYLLSRAHVSMMRAIREYGRGSQEALQALGRYRQAEDALAQEAEQTAEARSSYLESLQPTEAGRSRVHLAGLRAQLARFRGDPKHHSQADIFNLMAQINDAARQQVQQAAQDAAALIQAQYQLRIARTEDPVQQARLELAQARALLHTAKTPAERLQMQADIARAVIGYRNARLQSRVDQIDFLQQMGRIDVETAISMYQQVLRTHNLSRQWRQRILLAIHSLEQQAASEAGGFDLEVGSLKLPTIYDVRKAFDPIRAQIRAAHHSAQTEAAQLSGRERGYYATDQSRHQVTAQVNVYVNDKGSVDQVYDALDNVFNTHIRSKLRSRHHRRGR